MAKARISVTQSWVQVATGAVVVTIDAIGDGVLFMNETASDATAYRSSDGVGAQFQQSEAVTTYVRATGDGWAVIVDGVL